MSEQLDRPKLTRAILETHGIHYHENVYVISDDANTLQMPLHVDKLRMALIDFSTIEILAKTWKSDMEKQKTKLQVRYQDDGIDASGWELSCPDSAYVNEEDVEKRGRNWKAEVEMMQNNVYTSKAIVEEARKLDLDAEATLHFDEFSIEENVLWTESKRAFQWEENFTLGIRERTGPKPDLTYGFKAISPNFKKDGFQGMPYFRNLSFDVLGELRARIPAIQSTVTGGLDRWQKWRTKSGYDRNGENYKQKLLTTDHMCFPWAVVEAKHAQSSMGAQEYCQCQLANATACAFDMQEKLIRSVDVLCPVDAIIGFTCIGPQVKLWLTYRGTDTKMHMVCVWASSLECFWGAMCLTKIVASMQTWASRVLRGKIVQYVDWTHSEKTIRRSELFERNDDETGGGTYVVGTSVDISSTTTLTNTSTDEHIIRAALKEVSATETKDVASISARSNGKRRIRVKLPPAPDSIVNTTIKSDLPGPLKHTTRGAVNIPIAKHGQSAAPTSGDKDVFPAEPDILSEARSRGSSRSELTFKFLPPIQMSTETVSTESRNKFFGTKKGSRKNSALLSRGLHWSPSSKQTVPNQGQLGFPLSEDFLFISRTDTPNIRNSEKSPSGASSSITDVGFVWRVGKSTLPNAPGENPPQSKLEFTPQILTTGAPTIPQVAAPYVASGWPISKPPSSPWNQALSPPKQALKSSLSESNLAAKAQDPLPVPVLTIFEKLALQYSTDASTCAALRRTSEKEGINERFDLPKNVLYPLLPAHTRSFSGEAGLKTNISGSKPRSVSDAGTRGGIEHKS